MRETDSAESYCEKGMYGIVEEGMYSVCGHPDPVGVPNVHYSTCRERLPVIINIDRKVILKRRMADKAAKKARRENRNHKRKEVKYEQMGGGK